MTTQGTFDAVAVGAEALGIAPESTAGRMLAKPQRAKANRLNGQQTLKVVEWMQRQPRDLLVSWSNRELFSEICDALFPFNVTLDNANFIRRKVLCIPPPAKAKPAPATDGGELGFLKGTLLSQADEIKQLRERIQTLEENGAADDAGNEITAKGIAQLRADVRTLASVIKANIQGLSEFDRKILGEIALRGAP